MRSNNLVRRVFAAAFATAILASSAAYAYGPLYIHDYENGAPYRWDVTTPWS